MAPHAMSPSERQYTSNGHVNGTNGYLSEQHVEAVKPNILYIM